MLYDHSQTNNQQALQVVAATSLVHRSVDNEIALTAENLRLKNVAEGLSAELAKLRNTDLAGLNIQIAELTARLNTMTEERDAALQQFATVKQREGTLKENNRKLQENEQKLIDEINDLKEQVATLEAKKTPRKR